MKEMNNEKIGSDSCNWVKVFNRLFVSIGLLFFLLVAPICWAFLPFAYRHIKKTNALVEANPLFLVFERMGVSLLLTVAILVVFALVLMSFRFVPSIKSFGDDCREALGGIRDVWRSRFAWLVWLAVFYSGARIIEMGLILGYPWGKGLEKASLDAVQDYGYFMGLILAVPLGCVTRFVWKFLQAHIGKAKNLPERAKRINDYGLCGKAITLSSVAFGTCVAFLTVSSGLLYICAKEPCKVWNDIIPITLIACGVAFLTNLAAGCKSMGKLVNEHKGAPTFAAILLSSIGINIVMSALTMLIAFFGALIHLGIQQKGVTGIGATIKELFCLYWNGNDYGWALWVFVGLFASVIAPIAQLIGVSLHDKRKTDLSRFGVRGSDWLVICGGFEPLFVALLMWIVMKYLSEVERLKLCWDHESVLNCDLLMLMAVLTVVVIAIVKIAEVWSEKNSNIRNALFRQVRGSSIDSQKGEAIEKLYTRALKLSLLKLYNYREELVRLKVWVTPRNENPSKITVLNKKLEDAKMVNCKLPEELPKDKDRLPKDMDRLPKDMDRLRMYVVNMVNGNEYFTINDSFTADVLKAHEDYCEAVCEYQVSSISLKRFVKKYTNVSEDEWPDVKKLAQSLDKGDGSYKTDDSMPFVLFAPSDESAAEYVRAWNELLDIISDSITKQKIVGQVNRMICDFKPKLKD